MVKAQKQKQQRRSGKCRAMLSATTTSLLLLSTLDGGSAAVATATAAVGANSSGSGAAVRLPQHRVRAPKRQVPYPENHPLGRHLNQQLEDFEEEEEEEEGDEEDGIVGGDGSRSQQQRRRRRQRQQENQRHGFLRFLNLQNNDDPSHKKRRRRDAQREGPETMAEGCLIENNDETLRYWTISGRNLVDSSVGNATDGGQDSDESGNLLVNVDRINVENEEASEVSGEGVQNMEDKEGGEERMDGVDYTVADSAAASEEEDVFDTNQYYNDQQQSSNDNKQTTDAGEEEQLQQEELAGEEDENLQYKPIRLRAIFTDDPTSGSKYLTSHQTKIMMEDIINPALYAWSKALLVVPVGGGGRRARAGDKLVVDQSQLYDNVSCGPGLDSGLPSVRVPREHMADGLDDTDTVLYISVSFADKEPTAVSSTTSSSTESPFPSLYHLHRGSTGPKYGGNTRRKDDIENSVVTASVVSSISNANNQTTDYPSFLPSNSPSDSPSFPPSEAEPFVETRPTCPGTYLASATYCSTDQYDRPVAGVLSLCISDVHQFFYDKGQIKRNIVTIMHEIGHILGFNAQSLANIRDPDTGEPLTPRDENGDVPDSQVECTGISPRSKSEIPLPSTDIMKFRNVRGGVRVATIVTPTVQRVARNMFGCRTLAGAELESGEGQMFLHDDGSTTLAPGECIGDHWARRLFRTDLMNSIVDDVQYSLYISSLTMAFFVDTGWYMVDSRRIAPSTMWGRNAGCNFVEKKCITSNGHVTASNNPFFCNNFLEFVPEDEKEEEEEEVVEIHGCSLDSSRKAVCSLVEYESAIPAEYDYFEHYNFLGRTHYYGGSDPTLDYCPVFEGFVNGQCEDEGSQKLMEVSGSLEVFGEDNSRCVIGHIRKKRTALCLPIACVIQEQSLMVKVDGYWKPCAYAGQIVSMWWNPNDYVVCPDPSHMCPTFYCPNDCFGGGGICEYQTGQCMCAISTNSSLYQRFEPCSDGHQHLGANDGTSQVVERIDHELPMFYIENKTLLLDDPKDFDDKVSRMFAQLSTGEVVGLVASFMMCVLFSFIVWSQLVKCYKMRLLYTSMSKVKSSVGSLSGLLSSSSRPSPDNDGSDDNMDSPPSHRRPRGGRNPQKEKMVATLLVQMRTEETALEEEEQQRRLQLGGLTSTMYGDESDAKKSIVNTSLNTQTIVDLSSSSDEEVLVNRSDLPALSEGRVLAVVGARIVEDEVTRTGNEDARSSAQMTSPTEVSDFTSPLYQDANEGRSTGGRMLRLRRHLE